MTGLHEDLQNLGLRQMIRELWPEIPDVTPKTRIRPCMVCGSTERAPDGDDRARCRPCKRRQNRSRRPA